MDFKRLFQPKTMAVVGVSLSNDRHPANVIYHKNNLRQRVKVFPVNGRGGFLQGETVFPRISDIPEKIDLAVLGARAEFMPDLLTDCIQAGVGGAVVISGGFAESGRKDIQDRIAFAGKRGGVSLHRSQLPGCLFSALCGHVFPPEREDRAAREGEEWLWSVRAVAFSWTR